MLPLCTIVTLLRLLSIAYWIADAHQALGALAGHRLDADAGGVREADLGVELRERLLEEFLELLVVGAARLELDAGVDVLGVLAEDHHVHLFGRLDRGGHALEPAHRAQAHVQVEHLAQRDVQRADAAADRRRERSLDRDEVVAAGLHGLFRQPGVVEVVRLLAGEDLHPVDLALAAVGLGDRGVEHAHGCAPDVGAGAVALDEGDDRVVRHLQAAVGDGDLLALGGHVKLQRAGHLSSSGGSPIREKQGWDRSTWPSRRRESGRVSAVGRGPSAPAGRPRTRSMRTAARRPRAPSAGSPRTWRRPIA